MKSKNAKPDTKSKLHPRNKHRKRYDFEKLIESDPELKPFVSKNKFGDLSVDFFNSDAVKALNRALLKRYYNISFWDIPQGYLCPPIPGRADYIHYIADLLKDSNSKIPTGNKIKGLDIGVGANCIYPIIGTNEYSWSFIGSDTDKTAINAANQIVEKNTDLKKSVETRHQTTSNTFFKGILNHSERIDFTVCNPPFHESAEAAKKASERKLKNLKGKLPNTPTLNFGGQNNELWYQGGEARFVKDMIFESRHFAKQCFWFTSLISKEKNLRLITSVLKKVNVKSTKIIEMGQGQKISRFVAWTFLTEQEQRDWVDKYWQ